MISKSQQNMAIFDDEIKFAQNMDEMPKNFSLDKINCDNTTTTTESPKTEENTNKLNENCISKQIGENNETTTNEFQSETRIQLSFSVDRLLSDKLQQNKKSPSPAQHDPRSEKCCDELNSPFSCCSLPNCLVNSANTLPSSLPFYGSSYQSNDEEMTNGPSATLMDFKSVVRPTPVRAMGNVSESGNFLMENRIVCPLCQFRPLCQSSPLRPLIFIQLKQAIHYQCSR